MKPVEETIEATLDSSGQLTLTHQPRLPPGPVQGNAADQQRALSYLTAQISGYNGGGTAVIAIKAIVL